MTNYHEPSELLSQTKIDDLTNKFIQAWTVETCHPVDQADWSENNKALGQCAPTVLIVQDLYGGEIAESDEYHHLWNILPDGSQQDFSRSQFPGQNIKIAIDKIRSREALFNHPKSQQAKTAERYELLKQKI